MLRRYCTASKKESLDAIVVVVVKALLLRIGRVRGRNRRRASMAEGPDRYIGEEQGEDGADEDGSTH